MFIVKFYNVETDEQFIEAVKDHKELDHIVEYMHNIYGSQLKIEIVEEEEAKSTRPSNVPPPLPDEISEIVLDEWFISDLKEKGS